MKQLWYELLERTFYVMNSACDVWIKKRGMFSSHTSYFFFIEHRRWRHIAVNCSACVVYRTAVRHDTPTKLLCAQIRHSWRHVVHPGNTYFWLVATGTMIVCLLFKKKLDRQAQLSVFFFFLIPIFEKI